MFSSQNLPSLTHCLHSSLNRTESIVRSHNWNWNKFSLAELWKEKERKAWIKLKKEIKTISGGAYIKNNKTATRFEVGEWHDHTGGLEKSFWIQYFEEIDRDHVSLLRNQLGNFSSEKLRQRFGWTVYVVEWNRAGTSESYIHNIVRICGIWSMIQCGDKERKGQKWLRFLNRIPNFKTLHLLK